MKEGTRYFKRLGKTILQYLDHPENNFNGDVGFLERRHIVADGVIHIGKEANNIDDQALDIRKAQRFLNKAVIMEWILALPQKTAEEYGEDRKTFQRIKQRIRDKGDLNLNTPGVKRLIRRA